MRRPLRTLLLLAALSPAACAAGGAAAVARPPAPAPAPAVLARHFDGPAAGRVERRCGSTEVAMGPVTVAGSWGPFGALVGCRTGPSPRVDLVRRLRAERWLGECVRHAGGGGLDLAFDVAGSGEVRAVDVVEATPAAPALASCLMRATGLQFLPTGCRWQGRFFYLLLGTAPPTPPQSRSNRVVSSR